MARDDAEDLARRLRLRRANRPRYAFLVRLRDHHQLPDAPPPPKGPPPPENPPPPKPPPQEPDDEPEDQDDPGAIHQLPRLDRPRALGPRGWSRERALMYMKNRTNAKKRSAITN